MRKNKLFFIVPLILLNGNFCTAGCFEVIANNLGLFVTKALDLLMGVPQRFISRILAVNGILPGKSLVLNRSLVRGLGREQALQGDLKGPKLGIRTRGLLGGKARITLVSRVNGQKKGKESFLDRIIDRINRATERVGQTMTSLGERVKPDFLRSRGDYADSRVRGGGRSRELGDNSSSSDGKNNSREEKNDRSENRTGNINVNESEKENSRSFAANNSAENETKEKEDREEKHSNHQNLDDKDRIVGALFDIGKFVKDTINTAGEIIDKGFGRNNGDESIHGNENNRFKKRENSSDKKLEPISEQTEPSNLNLEKGNKELELTNKNLEEYKNNEKDDITDILKNSKEQQSSIKIPDDKKVEPSKEEKVLDNPNSHLHSKTNEKIPAEKSEHIAQAENTNTEKSKFDFGKYLISGNQSQTVGILESNNIFLGGCCFKDDGRRGNFAFHSIDDLQLGKTNTVAPGIKSPFFLQ